MKRLVVNKIRCNKCGDEIESTYRHNYRCCKCGAVAVDGGLDYLRRTGEGEEHLKDRVLVEKKVIFRKSVEDGYWDTDN